MANQKEYKIYRDIELAVDANLELLQNLSAYGLLASFPLHFWEFFAIRQYGGEKILPSGEKSDGTIRTRGDSEQALRENVKKQRRYIMSISSSIDLVFCRSDIFSVINIISCLIEDDWTIYDVDNNIAFLPVNDNDNYDWQKKYMTRQALFDIIELKQTKKETIGINLYHKRSSVGITVLFFSNNEISIMCDINRKKICYSNSIYITDFNWYIESIIVKLKMNNYKIECFECKEY